MVNIPLKKIVTSSTILEQLLILQNLGRDISYEEDEDIIKIINKFQRVCGSIIRLLRIRS